LLSASARAGVAAAGLALVGCSDDEDPEQQALQQQQSTEQQDTPPEPPQSAQQSQAAQSQQTESQSGQADQAQPPSGPRRGGFIRAWLAAERHDRWDPHRSRFRYTQAAHSLMYNRLIRPASISTGELEADLCALPETPDETTYVFTLDQQAVFWDLEPTNGRAVIANDIAWNISRQQEALDASGLPDPHFFRRRSHQRTSSVQATSDESITLTTAEPDAAYLGSVHASPFAWITSPEAAQLYGDAWRDDPSDIMQNSGTGPYTPHLYNGFEITLARSASWWRSDSAWADGITFTSGDASNIVSLYDGAAFDRADFPLTNEAVESLREQNLDHPTFEFPLGETVELLAPLSADPESPLSDPRVTRAAGIAVDRSRLIERLYGAHGRASGPLPWYLENWSLSEQQLGDYAGYRNDRDADLAEVAALISAAGGDQIAPIPLVVADLFEGFFPGSGDAVRSMIADATGLEVDLEDQPFAEAIDALRNGQRFCFLGWSAVPQQADPTDDWRQTLHSSGPRNWSDGPNAELDALIDQMGTTFDLNARQDLGRQVQQMLLNGDAPQWQIKLLNGIQLGIHQPWFHPDPLLFDYAWSSDRLSTSWVDTGHETYPSGRELPPLEAEM
jgi:peptide/nickel transport system substrate-binding protein